MKKDLKRKKYDNNYFLILFLNLFSFAPLISKKFAYGHDTMYHIAQIDALAESILSLNFTKIANIVGNGLGYAPAIFYPKLPHYICTIFHLITYRFNLIYSINLYFIFTSCLICIFMYKFLKEYTSDKNCALMGTIFYITMPYYISEIYVRCAINEFLVLLFMPMIFLSSIYLLKNNIKKFYIFYILGYIGFINSHLVLCCYFTIFFVVYLLFNIKKYINNIKHFIIGSAFILILTLPNIVLLIEHKLTNLYVVFDNKLMGITSEIVKKNSINFVELLYPHRTNVYWFINIIVLLFTICGLIYIVKNNKKNLYSIIAFTIISIVFSLKLFPYNLVPKLLLSIQFAFRNNCFIIFGFSVISSIGIKLINKKYLKSVIYISTIICLITSIFYINKSDFRNINKEESTYDVSAEIGWNKEYLTKKTYKNIDYFLKRDKNIKVSNNNKIEIVDSKFPSMSFKVSNVQKHTKIELPRLYYLGYSIRNISNKKNKKIKYYCNNKGFIEFTINEDSYINVVWTGTIMYNTFRLLRLIIIIAFIVYYKIKMKGVNRNERIPKIN